MYSYSKTKKAFNTHSHKWYSILRKLKFGEIYPLQFWACFVYSLQIVE